MMAESHLPDPVTSPETEAFWTAAGEGRFLVRRCRACGKAHWYPRTLCPFCASMDTEWSTGSGLGEIYTYSVMRRTDNPFIIAYVTLLEGPRMMTHIVDCDPDNVRVGDAVRLVFRPSKGGYAIPCFRLAGNETSPTPTDYSPDN